MGRHRVHYNPQLDYYDLLGVDAMANADTIQRAYRQKAKTLHPDVNPSENATEEFQHLVEAYNVLSNPELRRQYNSERWRFTSYGSSKKPPPPAYETQYSDEVYERASQWRETRWDHMSTGYSRRAEPAQAGEAGDWLHAFGLGTFQPAYKTFVGLFGSPYRYILLVIAIGIVLNGIFIVAGLVFADDLLYRDDLPTVVQSPSPTGIQSIPQNVSGVLPTAAVVPTVTIEPLTSSCDPYATFVLPDNPRIGQNGFTDLYGSIAYPDIDSYTVNAFFLGDSQNGDARSMINLAVGQIATPVQQQQLASLEPLFELSGYFRIQLNIKFETGETLSTCEIVIRS